MKGLKEEGLIRHWGFSCHDSPEVLDEPLNEHPDAVAIVTGGQGDNEPISEAQSMYENMMTEYQTKKEKFDREVGTMSSAVRQVREKELMDLGNRIQEFQASAQEDLEDKQYELAKPFQDAIQDAINKVAKANGYSYIFDTKTLLYYGTADDITPMVKKELGIK